MLPLVSLCVPAIPAQKQYNRAPSFQNPSRSTFPSPPLSRHFGRLLCQHFLLRTLLYLNCLRKALGFGFFFLGKNLSLFGCPLARCCEKQTPRQWRDLSPLSFLAIRFHLRGPHIKFFFPVLNSLPRCSPATFVPLCLKPWTASY